MLSTSDNREIYGVTSATVFPFHFKIFAETDLKVYRTDSAGSVTLVSAGLYTVSGVGSDAGSIDYPTHDATDLGLEIIRQMDYEQSTVIRNQGDFYADVVEKGLDRLCMLIQQVRGEVQDASIPGLTIAQILAGLNLTDVQVRVQSAAPGAQLTYQHEINARVVHLMDFLSAAQRADIKTGAPVVDCTAAINAAITYAHSLTLGTTPDTYGENRTLGGATLLWPSGRIYAAGQIVLQQGVAWRGQGVLSTVIQSDFNGGVGLSGGIITTPPSTLGAYSTVGIDIDGISIIGDRTKAAQIGLALLRPLDCNIRNVRVSSCGSDGIQIRQAGLGVLDNVHSNLNVGHGIHVMDGFNSWADQNGILWPSNALEVRNGTFGSNDKAGICLEGNVNGCIFRSCNPENNYLTAGNNVGYNIELRTTNFSPNEFIDCWAEGPVQAHVYSYGADITCPNRFTHFHHYGGGLAGTVDRAIINDRGTILLDGCYGHSTAYKTLFVTAWVTATVYAIGKRVSNGGNNYICLVPHTAGVFATDLAANNWVLITGNPCFRVNKASGVAIYKSGRVDGSVIPAHQAFEDENGNTNGLANLLYLDGSAGNYYGDMNYRGESTGSNANWWVANDQFPRVRFDINAQALRMGLGYSAPTSNIYWGTGDPNTVKDGTKGSLYMRLDGGANTCLYVKETNAGTLTGWVGK